MFDKAEQDTHESIDDQICDAVKPLTDAKNANKELSTDVRKKTIEKLQKIPVTSMAVKKSVFALINQLESGSEHGVDLMKIELHYSLVSYRDYYTNPENFITGE